MPVNTFDLLQRLLKGKKYCVLTAPGDPFVRPARARLIWASNTAQAVQNLGHAAMMAGGVGSLPIRFESPNGVASARRQIQELYNVAADFDLLGLYDVPAGVSKSSNLNWLLDHEIPHAVFPYCGILHTRHPMVLATALRAGLTCVYEDHDEDHNTDFMGLPNLAAEFPNLRLIVAITQAVKKRLVQAGVPEARIIVLDSGVNQAGLLRQDAAVARLRAGIAARGFRKIVVYSGGLQAERGIAHIVQAADAMPEAMFVLFGGSDADQQFWRETAVRQGVSNIIIPGYVPQGRLVQFQQAADVLIATRQQDARANITSPLKFFEYLAAGSPIVAAEIPALERHAAAGLALMFYDPARSESLVEALRECFDRFAWTAQGYAENMDRAADHSWEKRQLAIFEQLVR